MKLLGCCLLVLLLLLGISSVVNAQVEPSPSTKKMSFETDTWHVSVSPYLWLAGLNGNVTLLGHEAAVDQSFGDILGNVKVGVMGLTEVRRGSFASYVANCYRARIQGDEANNFADRLPATLF